MLTGASILGGGDIAFGSPLWLVPGAWPVDLVVEDAAPALAGTDCDDMAGVVVLNDLNAASWEAIITAVSCAADSWLSLCVLDSFLLLCLSFLNNYFDGVSCDGFLFLSVFLGKL